MKCLARLTLSAMVCGCGLSPDSVSKNFVTESAPAVSDTSEALHEANKPNEPESAAENQRRAASKQSPIEATSVLVKGNLKNPANKLHDFRGTVILVAGDPWLKFRTSDDGSYEFLLAAAPVAPAGLNLADARDLQLFALQRDGFDLGIKLPAVAAKLGQTTTLAEAAVKPLGTLQVKVSLNGQKDCEGISVYIPGTSYIAMTNNECAATIQAVPEGEWEVSAAYDGYERQTVSVAVKAGGITVVPTIQLLVDTGVQGSFAVLPSSDPQALSVKLKLTYSKATLMKIGSDPNLLGLPWIPVQPTYIHKLPRHGEQLICANFANANGLEMGATCQVG